jgi:competence protein ComEA
VQLRRRHVLAYAAVAVLVAAVGMRYVVLPRASGAGADGGTALGAVLPSGWASPAPTAAAGTSAASPAPEAVVYVCGAVRAPGIVRLPADARVADAVTLAGGPTGRAQLDAVNLAAKVVDGQQIFVPARGESAAAVPGSAPAGGPSSEVASSAGSTAPVNINTATLEQLDALQGVGPATAQKIIDYRTANGPFKRIEDIKNVSGIGDAKFAAMKDSITV